jgi:hypothetical protein
MTVGSPPGTSFVKADRCAPLDGLEASFVVENGVAGARPAWRVLSSVGRLAAERGRQLNEGKRPPRAARWNPGRMTPGTPTARESRR